MDLGTGAVLARDVTDGDRRVIGQTSGGLQPGVAAGSDWDVFWLTTPFGRKALEIERARICKAPFAGGLICLQ